MFYLSFYSLVDFLQYMFWQAFRTIFRITDVYQKEQASWIRLLEEFSKKQGEIVFWIGFFTEWQPNIVRTNSAHKKVQVGYLEDLQQKVFISWNFPFNFPLSLNVGQPVEGRGGG